MKHTPGPWHVGKSLRIIGANSQRVAVCDDNEATPGLVNARLIAAAPDLLAALIDIAKIHEASLLVNEVLDEQTTPESRSLAKLELGRRKSNWFHTAKAIINQVQA